MINEPIVSVVIPTYNREKMLPAAIKSVLDQSLANIEIIVVDDGSTDDTQNVLSAYTGKIKYIVTENKGPAHARNVGMKAATGKYIAFLDSDDVYRPDKLELQVEIMMSHPEVGMVYTESSAADKNGVFEELHLRTFNKIYDRKGWTYDDIFSDKETITFKNKDIQYYSGELFQYVLMDPLIFVTTIMFPREILEKVGHQNETIRLAHDYEFTARICKYFKVAFLDTPTYVYFYHDEQVSKVNHPNSKNKMLVDIQIQKEILQTVLQLGCEDNEYYLKNKAWLSPRMAELYHCLGEMWLEYGDKKNARECFKLGICSDKESKLNKQGWYLSFLPSIIRRIYFRLHR